ncbi:DUF983 domain-containing protein [Telluribacter humicola]|uniref:DUF983 domain-containing protein n=1 Tax=Telluribacter humicola TaxID=1720261 RepID=UPI001E41C42A|nr:DUF983 domain-containing protein [Telluribacter humicola]
MPLLKGTKIYSILANKCPRCHEGDFFQTHNPYDLRNFDKLHDRCQHCNENFTREPGFYIGSMYISYALSTALTVVTFVLFVVLLGFDELRVLYVLLPAFVFLLPVSFRTARLIWINIFVRYNRQKARNNKPDVVRL